MGDWKSRAQKVEVARSSWRDRAEPELKYGKRSVVTGEPHETEGMPVDEDPLEVSTPVAAVLGVGSGVSGNWLDEASGVVGALTADEREQLADPLDGSAPPEPSFSERYQRSRDAARDLSKRANEQHPIAYGAGEIGGDVLANTALGIATGGASLTPAGQGLVGAASGLGRTSTNLVDPTARDLLHAGADTALSSGLSAGGSAVSRKLGGWLKARAAKGIADAEQAALERATSAVDEGIQSARGTLGAESQKASRYLENLGRELPNASPELQNAAKELTDQGAVQAVRESVVGNTLENLPGQVGKIGAAKQALESAVANREADITKKAADLLADPIKRQLVPRLHTYASRVIPIAASTAVGSAIGGWPGMVGGSIFGTGLAAAMGKPGTALANAMKHPAVRKLAWEAVDRTIAEAPERLGQFAQAFARAKSPQAVDAMLSKDTEQAAAWQAKKLELLNDHLAEQLPLEDDDDATHDE